MKPGVLVIGAALAAVGAGAPGCGAGEKVPISSTGAPSEGAAATLWVEPVEPPEHRAGAFASGAPRPAMSSIPFSIDELPLFHAKAPAPRGAATTGRERVPAEVTVSRSEGNGHVRPVSALSRFTRLTVGEHAAGEAGLRVQCGVWAAASLVVEMLDLHPDGSATLTRITGIFDGARCEAIERERVTLVPKAIVAGNLFGFRTCVGDPCEGGREEVTFVVPAVMGIEAEAFGPSVPNRGIFGFGAVSFPRVRGSAFSMTATVDGSRMRRQLGDEPPQWFDPAARVVVGVDVVESTSDATPTAVAFLGRHHGLGLDFPDVDVEAPHSLVID